jgi:hypothetical protein
LTPDHLCQFCILGLKPPNKGDDNMSLNENKKITTIDKIYVDKYKGLSKSRDEKMAYYNDNGTIIEITKEGYEEMFKNGDVEPSFEQLPYKS